MHPLDDTAPGGRRNFLAAGGMAALAAFLSQPARGEEAPAAGPSALEEANLKLVNDFCAAWAERDGDKLGAFFAENAVFRMTETSPPANGRETIAKRLKVFLGMAKKAEFVVLRSFAIGNIVLNDRLDKFEMAGGPKEFHMAGVFFIKDGKIQEWFDYSMPK